MSTKAGHQDGNSGFSLIELLITIVVIAILASVAYPDYSQFVLKSRRLDAQSELMDLAHRQEIYYAANATYTVNMTNLGYANSVSATTAEGYYRLNVEAATAACPLSRCFLLKAIPLGNQANDRFNIIRLHSSGSKEMKKKNSGSYQTGWDD
ncbi:type IV pilin protein [Solemya velum gill symbiont]|uniref:type IV pilin protein n=1 Tax=Solemya velum gill symbiont TaxID=2340 RepID=UPI000998C2CB|nr:type IV pilin protein [Solemya velum gill symbiont]OOY52181.1 hypothetical protein BOV97_05855 [Solemya velum gill symbiont]OOY56425.1 hypothetical protein BOV99_05305 [Solemya velum gill symbiont]OOY57857.1 hypothetical protein BOW00_04650 [Solemya velum gill symbiont]OOY60393.1 hypothetical protein BOW02_05200 [Solemya velum gill symbiont]OOY61519.1 hypothetical protein BOW04_09020 [Solemya velum gill symbiont]